MAGISRLIAVLCMLGLLAVSGAALAHSGTKDEQEACTPDVFRLCAAAIPSESKIVACLNKKLDKLSPACRAVMSGQNSGQNSGQSPGKSRTPN